MWDYVETIHSSIFYDFVIVHVSFKWLKLENVEGIGLLMEDGDHLTVSDVEVFIRQVVLRINCKVFPEDREQHIVSEK